jgi:hypothetical protein
MREQRGTPMILLVSGASATQGRYLSHPRLGWLRTPRNGNSIARIVAGGPPVGV